MEAIMNRITFLENEIKKHQEAYYNGSPIISDAEFDALWDELYSMDPENELFEKVGSDSSSDFAKEEHLMIMGSQSKANTAPEMDEYIKRTNGSYIVQHKMDGISLELQYENGRFVKGITRGDGKIGDDITENVKKMQGLKLQLSSNLSCPIRGEILLKKSVKAAKYPEAKNCRNQASGMAKRKDGEGCEDLNIVVYEAQPAEDTQFKTEVEKQEWLKAEGFEVAPYTFVENINGEMAIKMIDETFKHLSLIDYDIDGLVFKQNEINHEDLKTNYRPETQIALKPARTLATTKLIGIEWNMNNGTLTPVGLLEPVEILGSTVKRASLANARCIEGMGIEIGHEVTISKCGEIIPKILKDNVTGKYARGYEF